MVMESISHPSQTKQKKSTNNKRASTKINTLKGERDGRIRLPFDIASKFFNVHDKLGFSKASQTVDWLLTQSISAIDQLTDFSIVLQKKKQRAIRKRIIENSNAVNNVDICSKSTSGASKKEMRNCARARARERTIEKKLSLKNPINEDYMELHEGLHCEIDDDLRLVWSDHAIMA